MNSKLVDFKWWNVNPRYLPPLDLYLIGWYQPSLNCLSQSQLNWDNFSQANYSGSVVKIFQSDLVIGAVGWNWPTTGWRLMNSVLCISWSETNGVSKDPAPMTWAHNFRIAFFFFNWTTTLNLFISSPLKTFPPFTFQHRLPNYDQPEAKLTCLPSHHRLELDSWKSTEKHRPTSCTSIPHGYSVQCQQRNCTLIWLQKQKSWVPHVSRVGLEMLMSCHWCELHIHIRVTLRNLQWKIPAWRPPTTHITPSTTLAQDYCFLEDGR